MPRTRPERVCDTAKLGRCRGPGARWRLPESCRHLSSEPGAGLEGNLLAASAGTPLANDSEHLPSTPTGLSCSWRFQREEWWVRWLQLGREQQVPSGGGASCAHSSGRRGLLPPDQRPLSRLGGGSHGCVSSEDSSGGGRKRGPVQSFRPCLKPPVWKAIPTYPNPISSPPQPTGYI